VTPFVPAKPTSYDRVLKPGVRVTLEHKAEDELTITIFSDTLE
jgi:hypothetical protein